MLKYIDTLVDIRDLTIGKDYLCGTGRHMISYVSPTVIRAVKSNNNEPYGLSFVGSQGNAVFLRNKSNTTYKYDFSTQEYGEILKEDTSVTSMFSIDNFFKVDKVGDDAYAYSRYENNDLKYTLYDVFNPKIFYERGVFLHMVRGNRHVLVCNSLITGERLWEYDAKERASFYDIVLEKQMDGVVTRYQFFKNKLIIYSGMGHFACVELNTGKILWEVNFEGFASFGIDHVEGKLHARWGFRFYRIIDLETGAIELEMPFVEKLRSQQVDIVLTWFCVSGQKLYACTKKGELVALNKYTLDLMERYILPGNDDGIPDANAPIKMGNRIYIHDGNQQLHIFEEQDL